MKKIFVFVSFLFSAIAFAQTNDVSHQNQQTSLSQSKEVTKKEFKPFMLQAIAGRGESMTRSDDNSNYTGPVYTLKILYSPLQFSFANLIVGLGFKKENLSNDYLSSCKQYEICGKSRLDTDYILADLGLEFHPVNSNIKIIPYFEYDNGLNSNRTFTLKNHQFNTKKDFDQKVTVQKYGLGLEGLVGVTQNFFLGLNFAYYAQSVNCDDKVIHTDLEHYENNEINLVLSYSL